MGKGSSSSSNSTTENMYGNTTTTNPFFTSKTDSKGNTTTSFKNGTAGATAYNYVNKNIGSLLDNYLNPSLNNTTDQAKLAQFKKTMGETAEQQMQNNIINPLVRNNMVRSSQATNMYNNMYNQMNDSIADYTNNLLADSQNNTWSMINNLMNLYSQGYQGANSNQNTSLNASSGVKKTTTNSNSSAE